MSSGLYQKLVDEGLLISHEEGDNRLLQKTEEGIGYKVIRPEQIPYVSYPYEWCYSQLKDAALCTMRIQLLALAYGMVLKDASAYNIQFVHGRSVFIDTLSFEFYREGDSWVAYKQFCQHFIGPLALMAYTDVRLSQLFRVYIDGPALDLVSELLPTRTRFKYSMLSHIHLHAKIQARYADAAVDKLDEVNKNRKISALAFKALMSSIENCVKGLHWQPTKVEWGDYYANTNYQHESMKQKESLVADFLESGADKQLTVHDLGANAGYFSRVAAGRGFDVVSHDIDPVAVEKNYRRVRDKQEGSILPLLLDLTNPGGAIGWHLTERDSFLDRCSGNGGTTVLALALIHHLAISNNVPLEKLSAFFATIARVLIIEFVPKEDSQVKRLLATREDIFPDYHLAGFEKAFGQNFEFTRKAAIKGSDGTLYLLTRKEA